MLRTCFQYYFRLIHCMLGDVRISTKLCNSGPLQKTDSLKTKTIMQGNFRISNLEHVGNAFINSFEIDEVEFV